MPTSIEKRAKEALRDFVYELETGDGTATKHVPASDADAPPASVKHRTARTKFTTPVFSEQALRGAIWWESRRLAVWRAAGRLTSDGTLRVGTDPLKPYTMKDVARLLLQLPPLDRVAALIDLDGVVEANFMSSDNREQEYVRKVVEKIADERIDLKLQSRDEAADTRAIIREEIGNFFRDMLGSVGQRIAPKLGGTAGSGHQRKCSKCGGVGHTRVTCTAAGATTSDKWACVHCSDLAGKPLSDPVTHPIPSADFHKDDPSFKPEVAA